MHPRLGAARRIGHVPGAVAGIALVAVALVPMLAGRPRSGPAYDLGVYRAAGFSVLHGLGLYGPDFLLRAHFHDGFTYPPFAALTFVPISVLPAAAAYALWTLVSLVLLTILVGMSFSRLLARVPGRWRALALGAVTALAVLTVPVAENLSLGQVGVALTLACVIDVTGRAPRLPRGVLVGLATAVKLTPGLFFVHYVLTRQWRALATGVGTTLGAWALAWVVLPHDSQAYFLHGLATDPSRAGSILEVGNQSLWGLTHRALGAAAGPVWISACLVVGAVGMARARQAHRAGDVMAAATLVGLTSLLLSPVSWMHAGMWLIPAVGLLIDDGRRRSRLLLGLMTVVVLNMLTPHPPDPTSGPLSLRAWHESLVVIYLLFVTALPYRASQHRSLTPAEGPEPADLDGRVEAVLPDERADTGKRSRR